jgi:GAF domain-containing protein
MKRQSGVSEKPDELSRTLQDMELLNTVSFALQQSLRIEETVSTAIDQVFSGLDADGVSLYLIEDEIYRLAGFKGIAPQSTPLSAQGFIRGIGKTGKAVFYRVLTSSQFEEVEDYRKAGIISLAGVPITGRQGVLGVLEIDRSPPNWAVLLVSPYKTGACMRRPPIAPDGMSRSAVPSP